MFNSQNFGVYSYSHQNPIKLTDPDGNNPVVEKAWEMGIEGALELAEKEGPQILGQTIKSLAKVGGFVFSLFVPSSGLEAPGIERTRDRPRVQVFHRLEGPSQTPQDAKMQQKTGEIWGKENRGSSIKSVDAYKGPLPEGARGVEFVTPAPQSSNHPAKARWIEGSPGVSPASNPDYVKIPAVITKNTQTD